METDLVSSSKGKLVCFRMKELKYVLTKLGLPRQGKKQDLVERILDLLSDKAVAKIIDDTYRKMQISEAADLATMGQSGSDICNVNLNTEAEDSLNCDVKILCLCGTSLPIQPMLQCLDPRCQVWQHISCVIIPEKPMEDIPSLPPLFFCEMCRIKRADPFWVTMAQLVSPMKLVASNIPTDGTNPLQNAEATFQLTKVERDLLQNTEYDVQAWCILLNDKVSFRMQWPQFAELHVNGLLVRTTNRPGAQLLGANGRDDGALITLYIIEGDNKISLSGCDARNFCFGVRLVKRRTVEQVLNLIPKEPAGEPFEDALSRVRRCIGGGIATGNEDSDSDLEVIADSITVNLRCPMSGSRIKVTGRFKPCVHIGCFDLETFVELNQRARKWQCPICLKNYSLEDVIIDPFFNRVTAMLRNCGEDITEIEVKPDGSWRVKSKGVHNNLAQWHLPDGSPCVSDSDTLRPIKEESSSGNTIIARIKKNLSANVDVSKSQPITLSRKNHIEDNTETNGEKVVTMTSSASGSGRDNDDPSINQECNGYIDLSSNSFNEINQIPCSFDQTCRIENQMSASARNTDIIVLSDSEEENDHAVPPMSYESFCAIDNTSAKIPESYLQDAGLDASASFCFDLFSGSVDGVGISTWPYTLATGAGSGFQLFDGVSNVPDAFIDLEHGPESCLAPMNGFTSASKSTIASGGEVMDSQICHTNIEIDDHLIDNTLAFVSGDSSLQNFLPPEPSLFSEPQRVQHTPTSHGIRPGNWISPRLGSNGARGGVGSFSLSASADGMEMRSNSISNEGSLSSEPKSNRTDDRKTSDGPFSFPRQPRSVRQRVHLS